MPGRSPKQTAWRKSRKFGDVHGGRKFPKRKDNLFRRFHSLARPGPDVDLPLLLVDTLSKDEFFPLTVQEAAAAIRAVPDGAGDAITYVWLRRRRFYVEALIFHEVGHHVD